MDGGGVNSANIAAAVWNSTTRNLSGIGSTALVLQSVANTNIAASSAVDFRPTVTRFRLAYVGVVAGAAGATLLQAGDGANFRTTTSVSAAAQGGEVSFGTSVAGLRILNQDATNQAAYIAGAADFQQ